MIRAPLLVSPNPNLPSWLTGKLEVQTSRPTGWLRIRTETPRPPVQDKEIASPANFASSPQKARNSPRGNSQVASKGRYVTREVQSTQCPASVARCLHSGVTIGSDWQ